MDKQPHNNLWAEKLLEVSLPDSGEAWADMEAILDRKLPQRFRGGRRRWLLLILLLLVLIGVCNCPGRGRLFHDSEHGTRTSGSHINGTNPAAPGLEPTTLAARHIRPGPVSTAAVPTTASNPPAAPGKTELHPAAPTTRTSHKDKGRTTHRRHRAIPTPHEFGDILQTNPDGTTTSRHNPGRNTAIKNSPPTTRDTAGKNTPALSKLTPGKDSLRKDSLRKDSSHKKTPPPPQPQDQKEKDHGWVFGIGLNQFFPLGDQRGSTYNSNGLTGTLTDYLPVPMIRYYLSHKAYLQLEAQFNTPQPTAKNLVISAPVPDSTSTGGVVTHTATQASIQQLYYFNVPLSIHFNPWDNLNVGTGLQWSHLTNAVGEFDTSTSTSVNGSLPTVADAKSTHSFKGDPLYQRIGTNEFRFLFDVNYTYKHWVLGIRYNQALSKFVNLQLPATGATTQARNSSLQLYLRYILWDTRKKKAVPKTP